MKTKGSELQGSGFPLWVWVVGPALALIAVVVLVALLREGEEPADPGEFDESGPPAVYPDEIEDLGPGVTLYELNDNPEEYYGSTVTVGGEVSYVLGPHAFLMVTRFGVSADDMLVISPVPLSEIADRSGDAPLSQGDAVQVTGEVREFELPGVEREIGVDLDDELLDYREGTSSIVASSVSAEPLIPEAVEPVVLADLTNDPEEYYGRSVTVDGVVGETVEPNAFVLADEAVLEDDVLEDAEGVLVVSGPDAAPNLAEGEAVQVVGTLREFDLAAFEEDLGVDLDDALYKEGGRPAIAAREILQTSE